MPSRLATEVLACLTALSRRVPGPQKRELARVHAAIRLGAHFGFTTQQANALVELAKKLGVIEPS